MQPTLLLRGELPGARARFSGYFRVDLHVIENHLLTVSFSDFVLQQLVARNGISFPSLVLHLRHWHQVFRPSRRNTHIGSAVRSFDLPVVLSPPSPASSPLATSSSLTLKSVSFTYQAFRFPGTSKANTAPPRWTQNTPYTTTSNTSNTKNLITPSHVIIAHLQLQCLIVDTHPLISPVLPLELPTPLTI
jgi:hypothetical protein